MVAEATRSSEPVSLEAALRERLIKFLQSQQFQVDTEVPIRKGLHQRTIDLVAKKAGRTLVFEVRSQPASIDAVSALKMAGTGEKFVVSPAWDNDASKEWATTERIRLIRPTDLQSGTESLFG